MCEGEYEDFLHNMMTNINMRINIIFKHNNHSGHNIHLNVRTKMNVGNSPLI